MSYQPNETEPKSSLRRESTSEPAHLGLSSSVFE
jgi:hypothetical protein